MTLRLSHKRAKPRWLALALVVGAALALAVGSTLAHSGINSIPSNFFVVLDQQGANDVPAQSDLTQMGRDDTDATQYKLFWSWDQTDQWTGNGQTGDACALFDNDGDTNVNFVLCVRINNPGADVNTVAIVPLDATHPVYLFSCSDNKNDRCTNPDPVAYAGESQADAGKLGTLANSNLITETDPFPTVGSNTPHDSTVEARILKSIIPGTEVLVNVCSYPSAGNGGNNNPFDCIVNPGGGFLVIVKDAGTGVTSPTFGFTVNPGTVTRSIAGSGTATAIPLTVTTTASASETTIPSPWALQSTTCTLAGGGSTGTASATGRTGITIQSGLITTCTFVDRIPTGTLTVIKSVVNDNGGTKVASDFTYNVGDGTNTNETAAASPGKSYTLPVGTAFNVVENNTPVAGYTTTYSATGCSGTMTSGGSFTCTITNNDQAGTLTVIKHVINDSGGTATAANFTLDSGGTNDSPDNFAGAESPGTAVTLDAGSYNVTETGPSGYTASFSADCSGTIANGQSKTCTVTNDDNAATLIVIKHVINDNGGTATAANFTLDSGGANDSPDNFAGAETPGTTVSLSAGSYNVTESGPSGYSASFSADCSGTIANGQTKTCTVTNDDTKAAPGATTVMKWTLNDRLTLTSFRPNGTGGTATFDLYKDDATCSDATKKVFTETVNVNNTTGAAATTTGHTTEASGTYRWVVTYSGNNFNETATSACGAELTTLP